MTTRTTTLPRWLRSRSRSRSWLTPRLALPALATLLGALLGAAQAAPPAGDEVARQQLVDRAQAAHQSGGHREALDLAQRAAQIRRTPTLLLFIAEEQEELGALADAYAGAQQCVREAELDLQAKLREKTIQRCRALAERLKARISYIVVNAPSPPQGFSVTLSGQQLNNAALGLPYVMTPGKVTVQATAPGHVPYRLEIEVPEGKTVNVTVSLAPEPAAAACPPDKHLDGSGACVGDACRIGMVPTSDGQSCCWPGQGWDAATRSCTGAPRCPAGTVAAGSGCEASAAVPPGAGASTGTPGEAGSTSGPGGFRPAALALAGAGAAALVAGGVLWLVANGRFNDLEDACNTGPGCTVDDRRSMIDGVKRMDNWALGMAIGGAALIGGAAVVQWALPRPTGEERRAAIAVDPVGRTLLVGGRF